MLRKLYDKTLALAAGRHAKSALFGVSFAESSFFPLPPDLLLIPMVIAERHRWLFYATLCTIASVIGGLFGYAIGYLLFEQLARPLIEFYGYGEKFASFTDRFHLYGAWIVFFAGVTPFPYKVITIASGAAGLSLPVFIIASIFARGLRFFLVAGLLYRYGTPIRTFIEERLWLVFTVGSALLIGGFLLVKVL
ncbi:DedA family protein [Acuticoccus sp. M5D2P5]|uniref:YqaA family protein n=1 Tax=Acuticoccus kalidii TaxID=2910977 RepID=UPI001F3F9B35|nr:YqaA family protein [Acuticoccus kalidii]MCF3936181.1 DedA family protein [Acuticoccus kalidii]